MTTLLWMVLVPAAVAFALTPALLFLFGRSLPVEHEARRTVRVAAPPAKVFELLSDVRAIPRWRKTVHVVDVLAREPRVRFRERSAAGGLELEIDEAIAPSKLVVRTVAARSMAFEGTWTYDLASDEGGTRITLTERGRLPSPFARVFATYVLGRDTFVERTTAALAARFAR